MKRFGPPAFSLALITVLVISFLPSRSAPAYAASPDIVISQVYGGGGNNGAIFTNDFVELFNRGASTVSVAGWSIQYTSATGPGNFGSAANQITPLSGSLAPGHYLLVQEAAGATTFASLPTPDVTDSTPIPMSATGGKVALVNTTTPLGCNGSSTPCSAAALATIVDLVGWDGANFYEGTGPAPTTSNLTAIFRKDGGNTDTDNNANDFVTGTPAPRNSSGNPYAYGKASPNTALPGTTSLLTVVIIPGYLPASTGFTVSCDLSPIGGSASQPLYDDGTNGDVTASDNTFSYLATILSGTASGAKSLACAFTENEGRNGSTTITLTVGTLVPIPIGTVNGPVLDTDNGTAHVSPYVGKLVTVQGVIYEKTLQATTTPGTYKGFFLQNTLATADTNPNTSDGLFVFMNTSSTLGSYTPTVGDEVILSGTVSEFHNMTELVSPLTLNAVVRGNAEAEITPAEVNPPTALADANRYWERLQGMRVRAPAGSLVLGGRNVFSPADAEIWLARSDSTIAVRPDPYTRRAFRDAHPLDDNYDAANWDGNGYRMLLGSLGIKATAGNAQALIDPARTFSTLTNSPSGGLNYTFSKYRIEISDQPTFDKGVDPAANNPPQARERDNEFTIVDYNLENLYDYRDNPASGCDFAGNTGCTAAYPFIGDIIPAFNYVPANDEDYQKRLSDIATQIISDLHSPDVLMLQEVENQDFCKVADGALACDTGNADGKPDVL